MSKSVFKILKSLADNITNKGYGIEGLELSYVDIKERHLEVFTYSSDAYKKVFEEGFVKIGSLLFCDDTFKKSGVIIKDSKFRVISDNHASNEAHLPLVFSHFENPFSNENIGTKPTYSKWITHYRKSNLTGVFFFFGKRKISDFDLVLFGVVDGQDKKQLKKDVRNLLNKFTNELDDFSMVFERLRESRKDIIEQATRAAISQVMARNTSHNIGAHVMNKLIGDLSKLKIQDFKNYKSDVILYDSTKADYEILLDQISIFNNYVKCRMDYLADISFGTPLMQTNKYAYADLFKELDKVRLLLEHISGLDNFKFEIKFTRNGKEFKKDNQGEGEDDLLVAIPNDILGTQAFYNILENIIRNSAKHAQKPTEIDINGNSIKKTTVFTVNFIDTLEVDTNGEIKRVIDYCECIEVGCTKAHKKEIENSLNEFIVVEVYDNIPVEKLDEKLDLEESDIKEFNDKKTALPKDNKFSSYIDKLVFSQNKKLNEDILQENKLRSYSLGLVEMDASAAYLRKRPVEFINHRSYDIQYDESWSRNTEKNKEEGRDQVTHRGTNCRHFLKAFKKEVKKDDGKTESYLGYRFFLHRPAVVLVVTDIVPENKEDLKKQGIWIVTKEEFEKHLKPENGKNDGKVYPHEFVVIDSNVKFDKMKVEIAEKNPEGQETKRIEEIEFLEFYKTSLPIRVLNDASGISELIKKSAYAIEMECWKEWANRFEILKNKTIEIAADYNNRVDFSIVFLDHLHSQNNDATNYWNEHKDAYHCEALSTYAQQKLPEFTLKSIGEGENKLKNYINKIQSDIIHKNQLLEASISQVIVIDERIQEAAENRDYLKVPFKELYKEMHVIVPDKKDDNLNLSENSFENVKTHVEKYIKAKVNEARETDFILIHYSILERMYGKEEINSKLLNELIGESKINVVITSGRGTPDNLPKKVRFVNLSSVITAFVDIRSKYAINYLLNSSRKSNKI